MKKAQELPLNIVVIGALALFVLLLIGGVLLFGGGDLLAGITGMGPQQEEVAVTTFLSSCASKCRTITALNPLNGDLNYDKIMQLKTFCCESYDLNSNGAIEKSTSYGAEICSLAYTDCRISGRNPSSFCQGSITGAEFWHTTQGQWVTGTINYDFREVSSDHTRITGISTPFTLTLTCER